MILVEPYDVKAQTADGSPTTKRINLGEYKTSANHVQTATGETHYYATPEETPAKIRELMEWYAEVSNHSEIHPVVAAALFHHRFASIHPFDDGNGRLSRILMNLILMQKGYPPVVIKMDDRQNYYALLSRADNGDGWPFIEYISERLVSSLQLFLKAAAGGNIDEDEDMDKEIALLKMQLGTETNKVFAKSQENIENVFWESILPLAINIEDKLKTFEGFFINHGTWFDFSYSEHGKRIWLKSAIDFSKKKDYLDILRKPDVNIKINSVFGKYKDPANVFNLEVEIAIRFEDFVFNIYFEKDVIFSKRYNESLSNSDQNKIIKRLIQELKQQLSDNQQSPKS
jgi:hypothetical protein